MNLLPVAYNGETCYFIVILYFIGRRKADLNVKDKRKNGYGSLERIDVRRNLMEKRSQIREDALVQYDQLVSEIPSMERKGKTSPYTSVNGNMYTIMRKDGALGIRLSKEDREVFMEQFHAIPFENYGSMMKEYVEVPQAVFMDKALMVPYLVKSHEYAKKLPSKVTKKTAKKDAKSSKKKVTHEVGQTYKNGQVKSEILGDQLINYYEDGSIRAQGKIEDEKMEGKWIFNRKAGQLWQIGHFQADVKNGEWIRYDSKGEIVYHVVFNKGKVVEKRT